MSGVDDTASGAAAGIGAGIRVRDALPLDLPLIYNYVCALAAYERLSHEVVATPELLARAFFGECARVYALILEVEGVPAGFASWYYTFSTFAGRAGIFVEDIYVEPKYRNRGLGRAVFRHLARCAVAEDCGRLEWTVLDWNAPAIGFYRSMGAVGMDSWRLQRLTGEALARLARDIYE